MARGRKPTPFLEGYISFHEARYRLGSGFNPYTGKYREMAVVIDGRHYFRQKTFDEKIAPNFKHRIRVNSLEELSHDSAEAAAPKTPNVAHEALPVTARIENLLYPIGIIEMVNDRNPRLSASAQRILASLGKEGSKKVEYGIRCILGPDRCDGTNISAVEIFSRLLEICDKQGEAEKKGYFVRNFSGLEIFGPDVYCGAACKEMLKLGIGDGDVSDADLWSLYSQAGQTATTWKAMVREETRRLKQEASESRSRYAHRT